MFEAIEAAGGLTEEAAGERINQARLIADGEELYIPTKEEVLSISEGSFALPEAAKGRIQQIRSILILQMLPH